MGAMLPKKFCPFCHWIKTNQRILLQSLFLALLFYFADILSHLMNYQHTHSLPYFLFITLLCIVYFKVSRFFSRKSQLEIDQLNQTLVSIKNKDPMTGLPTRSSLEEQIRHQTGLAKRQQQLLCVVVIDIDRLREINRELGMAMGDATIKCIAERIQKNIRAADYLARIAGDQLAVTMILDNTDQALFFIDKLASLLEAPVSVDGIAFDVDTTFGLSIYPSHADSPELLIRHALDALIHAKNNKESLGVYDRALEKLGQHRLALFSELKQAIANEELRLFYQPQFDLTTGKIISAEALIRWQDTQGINRSPAEFISLAEQTRLLKPFTVLVIQQAVRQLSEWKTTLPIPISINLSAGVLLDRDLPSLIETTLRSAQVSPRKLVLEVTESMLMAHPARCLETLNKLHEMGCELSLDDFGTGYTSLSYLRQMPVRELKIDRSFVCTMSESKSRSIIRMILQMANELDIRTIAEGIETRSDFDLLATWGCKVGQGFLVSPAIPPEAFVSFVLQYNQHAPAPSPEHTVQP